ncbi:MAG TPA: NAD(P)H-hydrate dehydratase [Pirellulaceae bacterium]|nr:NAD(P)H-hydrate dehydratase [Pirellulaceae bacterium]
MSPYSTLPRLPSRRPDAHKGDFGRALLIGGSRGMAGAIALAGMSCLRGGAGLVKLAVPDCILDAVASFESSYMTVPLPCDRAGRIKLKTSRKLAKFLEPATCVACGPGLGRSKRLQSFVRTFYESQPQPLVIDADGLNALSAADEPLANPAGPRILTPHPGEFARLAKTPDDAKPTRDEQIAVAQQLASEHNVIIVLKGHRTIITDGTQTAENTTGNPGMATGGTGDVLTGIITALVCQGLSPFAAAVLGAHVHGLAGDLAAAELGQVSLIASDLLRFLPPAFRSLE